jgi:hypothetical protein
MMEKIKAYFETLEGLSTKVLTDSAEKLVRAEKRNVALLIAHIAEMSRRKAALACGYKNIFDYCVRRLNLSEGSVALRLQVANVSRRFPQLLVALAENRISLTVAGHLASHLREENVDKLLSDCTGMTKRAVEEYLVELRPKPVFNPSIRKRPSSKRDIEKARDEGHQEAAQEREQPKQPCPSRCVEETPSQRAPSSSPNLLDPARPDTFNFRFSADGNFKAKFERLAEVLGVENPLKNMAEIFERAVDISLEKKDPKKKLERRLQRESARNASSGKSRPGEISAQEGATSRHIPSELRERVQARAGYQCEYKAPDGTRCSSRTRLEIDHERPFALYRSHDERHLRLLCRRHNRFQAERVYGAGFIRAKIEEKMASPDLSPRMIST